MPITIGVGGFVDNNYWSSSENNANNAWNQNFNNGNQNNNNKNNTNYVRPVRGFQCDLVMTASGSSAYALKMFLRTGLGPQLISDLKV